MEIRLLRAGTDVSIQDVGMYLPPLLREAHKKSKSPYSLAQSFQSLGLTVTDPAHELVIATNGVAWIGFLWTEIRINRDLWIHQVYSKDPEATQKLWHHAYALAKASGSTRVAGLFHRGYRCATIYCEKFGLRIAAVEVELPVAEGALCPGRGTRDSQEPPLPPQVASIHRHRARRRRGS